MADEKAKKEAEAPQKAEAKEEKTEEKKSDVKLSPSLQKIVDQIEKLSVMEVADLVKALEDKFGVSAAAPIAVAAAPGTAAGDAAPAEEKTEFDVVLTDAGANKIAVLKVVREFKQDLGLVEAKAYIEKTPAKILEGAKKEDADKAKAKLEEAGAQIELK